MIFVLINKFLTVSPYHLFFFSLFSAHTTYRLRIYRAFIHSLPSAIRIFYAYVSMSVPQTCKHDNASVNNAINPSDFGHHHGRYFLVTYSISIWCWECMEGPILNTNPGWQPIRELCLRWEKTKLRWPTFQVNKQLRVWGYAVSLKTSIRRAYVACLPEAAPQVLTADNASRYISTLSQQTLNLFSRSQHWCSAFGGKYGSVGDHEALYTRIVCSRNIGAT